MMLCEKCQSRPATVHIVITENGYRKEEHLCDHCAAEAGHFNIGSELAWNKFFPNFFADDRTTSRNQYRPADVCPNCGLSYRELINDGKFRCSSCYDLFASQLQPLLLKIHAADRHVGKIPLPPGSAQTASVLDKQLEELRKQMAQMVMEENFEQAAVLRDRIKNLEAKQAGDQHD